jgi:hypothetical protein
LIAKQKRRQPVKECNGRNEKHRNHLDDSPCFASPPKMPETPLLRHRENAGAELRAAPSKEGRTTQRSPAAGRA